ncbi:MAG: MFS transporter [Humibacillus sp.]|nr:MFS transporter [Humibacillus sp.]MDN5778111.1 MFS transporter [Humibacillus sp.]
MKSPTEPGRLAHPVPTATSATRTHGRGFWIVVAVFAVLMAFTTLPTPLYPLYQQRDGFPTFVITLIFAAYGFGVMAGLYLTGHVSDYLGRRKVIMAAASVELASAIMFTLLADTTSLLIARFLCGVGIGALTATATAHLSELRSVARPREDGSFASTAAGVVNTGGLALGPLVAGLLTQWLPAPLTVPFAVWVVLISIALAVMLLVPETVPGDTIRPAYRPQQVHIDDAARPVFAATAVAAASAFSVLGVFTSLTASFVGGTLHHHSRLLSGAIVFGVIGASALSQVLLGSRSVGLRLRTGMALMAAGLILVATASLTQSLALFVVAGVLAGAGVGLVFNVALATSAQVSSPEHRGGTLAGMFLAAYAGITVPVIAAGVALTWLPAVGVLATFALVVLFAVLVSTGRMIALDPSGASDDD